MRLNLRTIPLRFILLLIICLSSTSYAQAQAGGQVTLTVPDSSNFPQMIIYIDAAKRDGTEIIDLSADQLTLLENDVQQEILDFERLTPGVQIVTAINISPPFAIQDINGMSRFEFIKEGLLNWTNQPLSTSPDDLSLITNDGVELTHQDDKEQFKAALEEYSPDLKETQANLNVLARAIEIASDPVTQLGMKRAVLFISSQPSAETVSGLDSLLSIAQENQVQIYTILISSPAFYDSSGASRLQDLSVETGGKLLPFSGEEPLVDFGVLFKPLRSTFMIDYESQIVTSGIQTVELSISTSLGDNQGEREFFLEVQPPNPIFISPPRQIIRKIPEGEDIVSDEIIYFPDTISLDVLVDFPDQHPRQIDELIFRVDGEIVDRKVSPPYDQFEWDLSNYETSAKHELSIEAVDSLGLSRISIATPIEIIVEVPPPDLGNIISNNAIALGGLSLIILVGLFLFVLISRGRIQPADPVQKNPLVNKVKSIISGGIVNKALPSKISQDSALTATKDIQFKPYRLIPINDISQNIFTEPIRITKTENSLGNDPKTNDVHIPHHSISREHAMINLNRNSKHQLKDLGSPVGTWINYKQIPSTKPQLLKDGDIINIGEAGFRFQIMNTRTTESSTRENNT